MRMHKLLAVAALSTCLLTGGAWAQSTDERLQALEQRIQQLEERLAERDAAMMEKERALAKLQAKVAVQEQTAADIRASVSEAESRAGGLEIGGAVEVEFVGDSPYEGKSESTADTATVDVAFAAEISDAASAEIALTMGDEGGVEVDEAFFTVDSGAGVSLQAGQFALPFAAFDTGLVSDPLALELGEAGESALLVAFESEAGLSASAYVFNGGVDYKDRERIGDFGVQADYGIEMGGIDFSLGVGWINDVAESDTLEDAAAQSAEKVAGLAVSGGLGFGPVSFTGHYMAARDKLDGAPWSVIAPASSNVTYDGDSHPTNEPEVGTAKPSAYGVEAGYALEMGGREVAFAAGWQRTREALALEMPESRVLFGVSTELVEGIGVSLEYARHNDYGAGDCTGWEIDDKDTDTTSDDEWAPVCGTGKSGSTVTLVLAAEF